MNYKINQQEQDVLKGLPHLQRLLYLSAIRPYMDFETGIVGIKRGISHQSLREELYVEPHPGYKSGSPSKDQIRRALKGLEKVGVIKIISKQKRLIVECLHADKNNYAKNKAAIKSPVQAAINGVPKAIEKTEEYKFPIEKAASGESEKAATPPVSGNYSHSLATQPIPEDFKASEKTIAKAKALDCPTANCSDEQERFIAYHRSRGTKSCDWDAEFLGWLLRSKQYQQEKQYVSRENPVKNRRLVNSKNLSAVDRVFNANQELISDEIAICQGQVIEHYG